MGDQEGDVEAAGEEAGMQQQVAAVLHRPDHGVLQPRVDFGMLCRRGPRPGQLADQRQRGQRQQRERPHGPHPAEAADQLLHDGREHELTERAAGIDDAGGGAARLDRHALCRRPDQHGKAAGAGAHRREQAERHDEADAGGHEGCERAADGQHHQAADQHGARTVAVGDRAGHRLHGPPGELAHRQRQADGDDAQPGRFVHRSDEQAERLAGTHGDHQDPRRGVPRCCTPRSCRCGRNGWSASASLARRALLPFPGFISIRG
jgi:hypothetical protein